MEGPLLWCLPDGPRLLQQVSLDVGSSDEATLVKVDPNELALEGGREGKRGGGKERERGGRREGGKEREGGGGGGEDE